MCLSEDRGSGFANRLEAIHEDSEIRTVLVTGAGAAFCAGGVVKCMGSSAGQRGTGPSREESIADQTTRQRRLTGALYAVGEPPESAGGVEDVALYVTVEVAHAQAAEQHAVVARVALEVALSCG